MQPTAQPRLDRQQRRARSGGGSGGRTHAARLRDDSVTPLSFGRTLAVRRGKSGKRLTECRGWIAVGNRQMRKCRRHRRRLLARLNECGRHKYRLALGCIRVGGSCDQGLGRAVSITDIAYSLYERRLLHQLTGKPIPAHVGVMCDGNRRAARAAGLEDMASGYRRGGDKITELVGWCGDVGVEVVTLWLLSTENITSRPASELSQLLNVIEEVVEDLASPGRSWRVSIVGALDMLPGRSASILKAAAARTDHRTGIRINVAVGYGGRQEIADAVRSLLHEQASKGTSIEELAE